MPPHARRREPTLRALYRRLGRVIGCRPRTIQRARDRGHRRGAVLERDDQDRRRRASRFNYLKSARSEFPGVDVEKLLPARLPAQGARRPAVRHAARDLARRSSRRRSTAASRPARASARAASSRSYDRYLRGQDGYTRVVINALGNRDDTREVTAPRARAGPAAAADARPRPRSAPPTTRSSARSRPPTATATRAKAGAYVAMDPTQRRGARARLLSRASTPTCSPSRSRRRSSTSSTPRRTARRCSTARSPPTYPTGSTFKPITAMASLEAGILTPSQTIFDDGEFKLGPQTFQNARGRQLRPAERSRSALKVSSDVFFYTLGERANSRGPIIQEWAQASSGSATAPGSTSPASSAASCPTAGGATPATRSTRSASSAST